MALLIANCQKKIATQGTILGEARFSAMEQFSAMAQFSAIAL